MKRFLIGMLWLAALAATVGFGLRALMGAPAPLPRQAQQKGTAAEFPFGDWVMEWGGESALWDVLVVDYNRVNFFSHNARVHTYGRWCFEPGRDRAYFEEWNTESAREAAHRPPLRYTFARQPSGVWVCPNNDKLRMRKKK